MNTCKRCGASKPENEFAKSIRNVCKSCKNIAMRDYRAANRENLLARRRAEYAANADLHRARSKKWREANPDYGQAYWNTWYEKNREHRSTYQRTYRQGNREALQERDRQRYSKDPHVRARRLVQARVAKGHFPKASDVPCLDCGNPAEEWDHYMGYEPPFDGLVQPVCRPCHREREAVR